MLQLPRAGDSAYERALMLIRKFGFGKFGIGKFGIKTPKGDQSWCGPEFLTSKRDQIYVFLNFFA